MAKKINHAVALHICEAAAARRGLSEKYARWFAEGLVETSLMGIDTHGLRLFPLYLRELDEGRANPKPSFELSHSRGGVAVMNADAAPGIVAGRLAASIAASLADEHGIGAVAVGNSNHFGAASIYGMDIAKTGKVALVTTSAAARMAPFNGRQPMFGTNPICFAAPAGAARMYLFDMATSQISYSQIKHYRENGQTLQDGWALDRNGDYTSEPAAVHALAPLGGYKGQGLAMMVQILGCLLTGMPLDHELEHLDTGSFAQGRQIGHLIIAMDVASFTDQEVFEERVAGLMQTVRETPAGKGREVLVAGDPQNAARRDRIAHGIPVLDDEAAALAAEARAMQLFDEQEIFGAAAEAC